MFPNGVGVHAGRYAPRDGADAARATGARETGGPGDAPQSAVAARADALGERPDQTATFHFPESPGRLMPPFKPYASAAQERFFHTDTAKAKGISAEDVQGKDQVSKGRALPKKVSRSPMGKR